MKELNDLVADSETEEAALEASAEGAYVPSGLLDE